MFMHLERAWLDDTKIHDVADLTIAYALSRCRRVVPPRVVTANRPRADGARDFTRYANAQLVDLAGYVDAGAAGATQDAYDALAERLEIGREIVFRFRRLGRGEDERITAKSVSELDAPAAGYQGRVRWAITLLGPDPRVYSDTLHTATYDPTGGGSGFGLTFPLTFPLTFGTPSSATLRLNNNGTRETPVAYAIRGPAINPSIINDTTGKTVVALTVTIAAGETIFVDTGLRTVTLAGVVRRDIVGPVSTWEHLPPGESLVRLTGSGMLGGTTELEATWRDARM